MPQWRIKGYLLLGSRCVRNPPLNDSPTSVYKEGASTVANTLETKEALNGQVTNATSAALGNLNHRLLLNQNGSHQLKVTWFLTLPDASLTV
ncbi:hypothetical protein Tco_1529420 [Tanacetum coccineum]